MISDKGKYYLYRHIRLDKDEPFYIGIGTKRSQFTDRNYYKDNFKRAYTKDSRSEIWERIVAKTDYEVEILLESDNYEFIKKKEIEFIKLYGRINLNTGILANLTDGGDGQLGRKQTKESLEKRRITRSKRTYIVSEETREKLRNASKSKPNIKEFLNEIRKRITLEHHKKHAIKNTGKKRSEETKKLLSKKALERNRDIYLKFTEKKKKKILNNLTNEIYDSLKECSEKLKIGKSELCRNLNNKVVKNKYPYLSYIKTNKNE